MSHPPWKLVFHTCVQVILSQDVDVTYLLGGYTLPGCWPAHTCGAAKPRCYCYIPLLISYPPWRLTSTYPWCCHTPRCWCHIPVVTSYPPWMLTCTFSHMIGRFLGIGNSVLLTGFTGLTEKASTWPKVKTQSIIWSILECKIATEDMPQKTLPQKTYFCRVLFRKLLKFGSTNA